MAETAPPARSRVYAAFAAVYVIWGSTYLAIHFALDTLPPFLMAAARFLAAGALLYGWARFRGTPAPGGAQWRPAIVVGGLLFLGGNGAVVWAQQYVPSGVAALLVAIEPMLFVLLDGMRRRERPRGTVMIGLVLGLLGVAVLIGPGKLLGGGRVDPTAALVLVVGAFCWAVGSLLSRGARMPESPVMATALTLLGGGALLLVASLVRGEFAGFDPAAVSARSFLALLYLISFGSLVGFTAYLWILRVATPARAATYAYVNPVVAVLLGWAFAGESLTARMAVAAAVIVGSVALIIQAGGERSESARPRREAA
ncbi:MAG: EamA family transporter [Thermoanaerobaculia bacterium]